jgi:hypothetical protein
MLQKQVCCLIKVYQMITDHFILVNTMPKSIN